MRSTRSVKVVTEEIEAAEIQFDRDRVEAKNIVEYAKRLDREFNVAEQHAFDKVSTRALQTKNQLTQLRNELEQAERKQEQIRHQSMQSNFSGTAIYNQNQFNAPAQVLPVNGILPGETRPRYSPYNRVGKLRAFRDEQSAFDAGMWYKAIVAREVNHTIDNRAEDYCRSVGMDITNVGYEGSGPAGGYLTPAPISSAIIEVREKVGVSRQVCNVLPTNSDTLTVPKRDSGLTVYIVGETATITASDKGWASVTCALKKRAVLSYLSQELAEDSLINIVDNIVTEQAYALALQEDDELINGTGASTYGGIQGLLSSIGAGGVSTAAVSTTWAALTMGEVTTAMGFLPDRYYPYEPSIICSHSFYNQVLLRLAFGAGGATANEVLQGSPNVRSFMGYKCYLTSKMPTTTAVSQKSMLFGAFSQAVLLADRGGIRLQRSDDIKFVEDLVALKAVSRYDMNVHDKGDASNAGAYVALSTHA